jgi:hypothetical protein
VVDAESLEFQNSASRGNGAFNSINIRSQSIKLAMALKELWTHSPDQLRDKHLHQIIAFAGSGKLRDGSGTSNELREFLANIPSNFLARYADDCLTETFVDSGLALQDVVNQIGRRLGYKVTDGQSRGKTGVIGFDGIWTSNDGHSIVVEVKTTDAYRIDLNRIAEYRRQLAADHKIGVETSSILIRPPAKVTKQRGRGCIGRR